MNRDPIFLDHMLHEIQYIERVCADKSLDDLHTDEDLQHMIARAFEILGEAARNISPETNDMYPDIPRREIIGVRDKIIYGYFSVNWVIIWDIISNEITQIQPQLEQIVTDLQKSI